MSFFPSPRGRREKRDEGGNKSLPSTNLECTPELFILIIFSSIMRISPAYIISF